MGVGEIGDTDIDDMVEGRILPWVIDSNTYNIWDNWNIENRDLIFLDLDGNLVERINLTDEFNEDFIINIINGLLNNN